MRFSEKIDTILRKFSLSNQEFGRMLGGVAHTTVAGWRTGATPRGAQARKLCEFLAVEADDLFDDSKPIPFTALDQRRAEAKEDLKLAGIKFPEDADAVIKEAGGRFLERHAARKLESIADHLRVYAYRLMMMADVIDPKSAAHFRAVEVFTDEWLAKQNAAREAEAKKEREASKGDAQKG
jgi:hypothetical protein